MIPLVYIQRGWFEHFELAVRSARQLHPGNPIVHIGDRRYLTLMDSCDFVPLSDVSIQQWQLARIYQHRSPNTILFERFCIERWFYLYQLMKKRDWQQCWVFDSDTLLYANFDILAQNYQDHGITINGFSPHATYIHDRGALERFCEWVVQVYRHPEKLDQRITDLGWGVPGISDMTLLTDFGREMETVGDNSQRTDFGLIDNNVGMPQGVVYANGMKVISLRRGVPYVESSDGDLVALNLIHFQGAAKKWMPQYAQVPRHTIGRQLAHWTTRHRFSIARRWERLGHSVSKRLPERFRVGP